MSTSSTNLPPEIQALMDANRALFNMPLSSFATVQPAPISRHQVHTHASVSSSAQASTRLATIQFKEIINRRPVNMSVIRTLIKENQVNPNTSTSFNDNLLHKLVEFNQCQDLQEALTLGVNPEARGFFNDTPLAKVINMTPLNMDAAETLIRGGAHPNTLNTFDYNLLHKAIDSGSLVNIKRALELGVDPTMTDRFKHSPLELARKKISNPHESVAAYELIRSAINSRKPPQIIHRTPVLYSSVPAVRSTTSSSVAPYLTHPQIIKIEQPPSLDSLLNRPNSGQLICNFIQKTNPNFESLTYLGKSDGAKEQVFNYICSLAFDERYALVKVARDEKSGLGYFFNTYRFKWGLGKSHRVMLEELELTLEEEKKAREINSIPSSSYTAMPTLLQARPEALASAPPEESPLYPPLPDPEDWGSCKDAPAAAPVPRPEEEGSDDEDEAHQEPEALQLS